MIPVCRKVIMYGEMVFTEGMDVSVKLRDKPNPLLGKIVAIDSYDFVLNISVSERVQTKWICFSQIEKIERQDKDYELRYAARVVRNELLNHGEWYNALVSSIGNCLEGIMPEMLEKDVNLGKIVADRII